MSMSRGDDKEKPAQGPEKQHPETEEKNLEREQCHGSQTAKSRGKEDWAMSELLTVE